MYNKRSGGPSYTTSAIILQFIHINSHILANQQIDGDYSCGSTPTTTYNDTYDPEDVAELRVCRREQKL